MAYVRCECDQDKGPPEGPVEDRLSGIHRPASRAYGVPINSVSSKRMMRSRSRGAEHHVPRRDTGGVVHAMLGCLEARG